MRKIIQALAFLIFSLPLSALAAEDALHSYYQGLGNWEENGRGDINLSTFIYFDVNRNGIYDLTDRPMSQIVTTLEFGGNKIATQRSNENGFANFGSSKTDKEEPINAPGTYTFEVHPPENWKITSSNTRQEAELIEVYGSIGGVGFKDMPKPIGLSPDLYIAGKVAKREESPVISVTTPEGQSMTSKINEKGEFLIPIPDSGRYIIDYDGKNISFDVGGYPVHLGTLDLREEASEKSLSLVNFDDISVHGIRKIPNGYSGLNWFNINAIDSRFSRNSSGYVHGEISEGYVAYTSSGHPVTISSDNAFGFFGGYLTAAWPRAHGETAIFEFWNGDKLISTDRVKLSVYSPVYYQPNMTGITRIAIKTEHYWQIVFDDLVFSGL